MALVNRRVDGRVQRGLSAAVCAVACTAGACAQDWSNSGGNASRNGRSSEVGPVDDLLLWQGGRPSVIAWQPVSEGGRMFVVRQNAFIPTNTPNDSPIVATDIATGVEQWIFHVPYQAGDWTAWIAGVRNGRVFVSRSGNGASVKDTLRCLDAATGAQLWESTELIDAGPYDGVVFADNGDPIIGSFGNVWRFDATSGQVVWKVTRVCSVSSTCGAVRGAGDALYIVDVTGGGHIVRRLDAATGQPQYSGPVMPGFTSQSTPMVAPDGTIYFSRTQNNASVDFFYAFDDTGQAITQRWSVPAGWHTTGELGVASDGSVYMMGPGTAAGRTIQRRAAADGTLIAESDPIAADFLSPRFAIDAQGNVFFSNGAFSNGRVTYFTDDLIEVWSQPIANINIGGPILGQDGVLVVVGVGNNVRAYQQPIVCYADCDGSGSLNVFDYICFGNAYAAQQSYADCDGNGQFNVFDYICFGNAYAAGCP